jgi:SAM-dependent methyltransferase
MSSFDLYAHYYDVLYNDKDYQAEVCYVEELLKEFGPVEPSILELGCGTGIHAQLFAEKGYDLHGVDLGENMIARAVSRQSEMTKETSKKLDFSVGNVLNVRVNKKFGAVISLFHVISYQVSNEDLNAAFLTASEHLDADGLFIFDVWYGPAVLSSPPEVRVKRINDGIINVVRIAEPDFFPNENRVDVNYELIISEHGSSIVNRVIEKHSMRYLFHPEIKILLEQVGMELVHAEEWLTKNQPGCNTWGVCFVAKKQTIISK